MIVLRAVRVEDDGAETELGEVRLTEVGVAYSHLSTAAGAGVIADVVGRLRADAPRAACAGFAAASALAGRDPWGHGGMPAGSL